MFRPKDLCSPVTPDALEIIDAITVTDLARRGEPVAELGRTRANARPRVFT